MCNSRVYAFYHRSFVTPEFHHYVRQSALLTIALMLTLLKINSEFAYSFTWCRDDWKFPP